MIYDIFYTVLFSLEPGAVFCDFGLSAAVTAGLISGAASVGSALISTFGQKEPKTIAPPKENDIAKGEADVRRRLLASKGYKSTILSDLSSQYGGMNSGMKTTLG